MKVESLFVEELVCLCLSFSQIMTTRVCAPKRGPSENDYVEKKKKDWQKSFIDVLSKKNGNDYIWARLYNKP